MLAVVTFAVLTGLCGCSSEWWFWSSPPAGPTTSTWQPAEQPPIDASGPIQEPSGQTVRLTAGDARCTSLYQYFGALRSRSYRSYSVCFWPLPGQEFGKVSQARFNAHTKLWRQKYPKLRQRDCNVTFWQQGDGTIKYAVTLADSGQPVDFPYMKSGVLKKGAYGTKLLGFKIMQ
jgi:hypothetical protein